MANSDDEPRSGLADAAGRAAFFPARAAARAWRGPLEDAVDEVLSAPEIARVLDRALAGSLPEEIARSIVDARVGVMVATALMSHCSVRIQSGPPTNCSADVSPSPK